MKDQPSITRRAVLATAGAAAIGMGGCLGLGSDDEGENSSIVESSISVSNHTDTEYEVTILVDNLTADERLVDETFVPRLDEIVYFDFSADRHDDGTEFRAEMFMSVDDEIRDSATAILGPNPGTNFYSAIRSSKEVRVGIDRV